MTEMASKHLAELKAREDLISTIAEACHEAERAYCTSISDNSQVSWAHAEQWQRDSTIAAVKFLIDNPSIGDSAPHDNWYKDKIADGWVYGEEKNAEKKTHPCLIYYSELPTEQQAKEALFRKTARNFIDSITCAQLQSRGDLIFIVSLYSGLKFEAAKGLIKALERHGIRFVPATPTEKMLTHGTHINSEWLNDAAPIGENRYRDPANGVFHGMCAVSPFAKQKDETQ